MRDDAELLRAFAENGSDAAFSELVQRHIDFVYAGALRRLGGDAHRANDVTQEVFTRLARKATSLLRHPSLAGWLHTCTRFAAADVARQQQRRQARESASAREQSASAPAEVPVDWEELRPFIDDALDQLPAVDREAVLLRFFSGQPWAQVGARLRVSEDAARKRVEYALERLRITLARRGVTSTAAALALGMANVSASAAPAGLAGAVANGALAAAAQGGAMSAFLSLLMSTAKSTGGIGVWAIATATMIGTASLSTLAWREHRGLGALRTELAIAQRDGSRKLAELQKGIADAQLERDAQQKRAAEVAVARPAARPSSPTQLQAAVEEALNANPEYTALTRRAYRLDVQKQYGAFLATLSAEHSEALTELLVRRRELQTQRSLQLLKGGPPSGAQLSMFGDMGGYAVTVAPTPDSPEMALMREMKMLLGEPGYAKYEQYDRLRTYARPADRIAADLREQGAPLSDVQRGELQRLLHETQTYPGSGRDAPNMDPTPTAEEASLRNRAQAFLSPDQTKLLTAYLVDQRVAMSFRQRLTSTVFSPPATTPAPGPSH